MNDEFTYLSHKERQIIKIKKEEKQVEEYKEEKFTTKTLVRTAILALMIVLLAYLPINVGALSITLTIIPIAVGALLYGPLVGAILGLVFGLVSFIQCFGYSPFGLQLLSINWFLTFLVCVPTRILAGFIPGLISRGFKKAHFNHHISDAICSILVPLLNTVFFMSMLIICFYQTEFIQGFVSALGASNAFMFVILFVGINGLVELLVGAFITFPLVKALNHIMKR